MKRILSMLLVLCMVISMLPLAVFAVEPFTGTATADGDSKYTTTCKPDADGTLTVTVGDGTTNWTADVAYFGDSLNPESVGTCSGSESDSFSVEVVADTKYYIRVWATDGNGLSDTPVSYTFVPASGEEDAGVVAVGDVLKDDAGAAMKGTDIEIPLIPDPTGNAPYAGQQEHFFTPTTDGILTVHIIGSSSDWWYSGENLCGMVTGSGEWAETYEVRAGTTYSITLGCYEEWNQASGTISYEVLFYAKELAAVQEKFMFAENILVGEKVVAEIVPDAEAPVTAAVTMMDNAASTVVGITPDVVGVYTVTVSEGATVADMGTNGTLIDMIVDSVDYGGSVVWTCKEVSELKDTTSEGVGVYTQGQTLFVGIKSDAETVHVTVEKTGDYEAVEEKNLVYENKAELSQFVLPEEATLGDYINVFDSVDHVAVLGDDGYYHLDSEDGDILLVDMDYASIVLTNVLSSERPVMNAYATLEDGTRVCYSIADAVKAYEAVCDENGYYPLTEDLVFFYQTYGVGNWVYSTVLDTSMMQDADVWMYCMRTMTLPGEEGGDAATSGTIELPVGAFGDVVAWTAPASGTVTFSVNPENAVVLIFNPAVDFMPVLDINGIDGNNVGSGTMEVTEGTVYEFENYDNTELVVVTWEFATEEEPDVPEQPATLVLGENALSVEANDLDGGSWTFTATEAGTLTATVSNLVVYNPSYEVEGEFVPEEVPAVYLPQVISKQMSFQINGVKAENGNEGYVNVEADDVVTISLAHNMATQFDAILNLTLEASSGGETGEPDGTEGNPYVITVADLPLTINGEGDHDLYYTLTVEEACNLKITYTAGSFVSLGDGNWEKDSANLCYHVALEAGETLSINPWATSDATYVVSVDNNYEPPVEPIEVEWNWDEDYLHGTATVTVAAGETVSIYGNTAMIVTVNGEEVAMNEEGIFSITNSAEEAVSYELAMTTPVGAYNNPQVIDSIGYFSDSKSLKENGEFNYVWTATEDTTLVLEVSDGANIYVTKLIDVANSEWPEEESYELATPVEDENWNYVGWDVAENLMIPVQAGDMLKIQVVALTDWETWTTPAIDYTLDINYAPGSAQNPITLYSRANQVTVEAGATVYYTGRFGGMVMTASGEGVTIAHNGQTHEMTAQGVSFNCVQNGPWNPPVFALTNNTEEAVVCQLNASFPAGSQDNPDVAVLDENVAEIAAGSQGYFWSYTADFDGKLEVSIESDVSGWAYCINNLTSYAYGDTQWSDSDPVVNPSTVSVKEGDELQIMVNTYDPTDPWNAPAGTVTLTLTKEGSEEPTPTEPGSQANPFVIESIPAEVTVVLTEDNATSGVWYKYVATEDTAISIDVYTATNLYVNGESAWWVDGLSAGDELLIHVLSYDGAGEYVLKLFDPSVAKVGDVTFTSLGEALAAAMPGDVVTLLADVDAYGYLVLPVGVSVDLGEHTLTADYIYGSKESSIIGIPQKSQLNVPKGNLILGQAATNNLGQYVLPIWDEANNCYQMSLFVVNTNKSDRGLFIDEANETIRFQFKVQATTAFFETLMRDNGLTDNDMSVIIRLQWKTYNKDGEELGIAYQNFVYNDTQVSMSTGNYDLSFTLTGFSALNISLDDLVVVALVETASGADAYGTEWNINNAK